MSARSFVLNLLTVFALLINTLPTPRTVQAAPTRAVEDVVITEEPDTLPSAWTAKRVGRTTWGSEAWLPVLWHEEAQSARAWLIPGFGPLAAGNDVTITSDTTWYSDTVEIGDLSIVNSATLTLAGASGTHLTVDDLSIASGAGLAVSGTAIITAANATVEAGASLAADGLGYGASAGPGQGTDGVMAYKQAGGGGHGGWGGEGAGGYAGGQPYDDLYEPLMMGSGGGDTGSSSGGAGGGAFQLVVSGTLAVSGTLSANGLAGDSSDFRAGGGGAGGSIWIEAGTFTGDGVVRADGDDGGETKYDSAYGRGGGGAGGRVAVYADQDDFSGTLQARGGDGEQVGGAGTVYVRGASGLGTLYVDNGDEQGASAGLLAGAYEFEDLQLTGAGDLTVISSTSVLTLSNGAFGGDGSGRLAVQGTIAAPASFTISGTLLAVQGRLSGATAITTTGGGGLELWASTPWHTGVYTLGSFYVGDGTTLRLVPHVTANGVFSDDLGVELQLEHMTVASGGLVEADGLGYGASEGPGAGTDGVDGYEQAGGGGHGGWGGEGAGGYAGGQPYDDLYEPEL
ncbi:MAG: hypothetical protein PVF45_13765, partial [Anaerolineae bacterium]